VVVAYFTAKLLLEEKTSVATAGLLALLQYWTSYVQSNSAKFTTVTL